MAGMRKCKKCGASFVKDFDYGIFGKVKARDCPECGWPVNKMPVSTLTEDKKKSVAREAIRDLKVQVEPVSIESVEPVEPVGPVGPAVSMQIKSTTCSGCGRPVDGNVIYERGNLVCVKCGAVYKKIREAEYRKSGIVFNSTGRSVRSRRLPKCEICGVRFLREDATKVMCQDCDPPLRS